MSLTSYRAALLRVNVWPLYPSQYECQALSISIKFLLDLSACGLQNKNIHSKEYEMKIIESIKAIKVKNPWTPAAVILAIGLAVGGAFIGNGIYQSLARRTVSVKGLSERDVIADLAVWNININKTGKDLAQLQTDIDADIAKIRKFFISAGFADSEIQNRRVMVRDNFNAYGDNKNPNMRYSIETGIALRSGDVNLVDSVSRRMGELVKQGIQISDDYSGPMFIFNGLNDIKISMIAEATKNATESGQQFAKDANASLGKIQSANQGVFSIESRDPTDRWSNDEKQSIYKKVRVVSTISFYLK
ncbi:MAG: SIMPL domain-containing protein [Rickettsiales bacterium]|nr:SIMPL domain-containing protein [Rickettsiales bacterium]